MEEIRRIAIFGKSGSSITIALLKYTFCRMRSKIPCDVCIKHFENNGIDVENFDNQNINSLELIHFNDILCLDLDYSKHDVEKIKNIILAQNKNDCLILNVDDKKIKEFYHTLKNNISYRTKIIPISIKKLQKNGASFIGNEIYFFDKEYLTNEFKTLTGEQNKTNILASLVLLVLAGLNGQEIIENFYNFGNIDDVFETISHKDNFTFINDIKNQNKLQSLNSFENIYLILCIACADYEFERSAEFIECLKKVKYVFILGEYNEEILKIFRKNNVKYFITYNMNDIFREINKLMKNEKLEEKINVILSSLDDSKESEFYKKCSQEFEKMLGGKNE
jgi:UDP-N-acetylmuramoylalanine-D-glutamate ligase